MGVDAKVQGALLRILTFVSHYLPGYRAGGPLRSISNLVDHLGSEFSFLIVTLDRDAESETPYDGIAANEWNDVGNAKVFYAAPDSLGLSSLRRLMRETDHDIVYLNSFFNPNFTIMPLLLQRFGHVRPVPTVVAPRGEFSEGALTLKRFKKSVFISVARLTRLYARVMWQASSPYEAADLERVLEVPDADIVVAPDLLPRSPAEMPQAASARGARRSLGKPLRVIFLSRITRKKNLDYALRILGRVRVPVEFTIVGTIRDAAYWEECRTLIEELPDHIRAHHLGDVAHSKVHGLMADHDLFFLPTRGENYGHVIPEALVAGTPVLISDTTPWRRLEEHGVGWDLPLEDDEAFVSAVETIANLSMKEFSLWRHRAYDFGLAARTDADAVQANRELFVRAARMSGSLSVEVGVTKENRAGGLDN